MMSVNHITNLILNHEYGHGWKLGYPKYPVPISLVDFFGAPARDRGELAYD